MHETSLFQHTNHIPPMCYMWSSARHGQLLTKKLALANPMLELEPKARLAWLDCDVVISLVLYACFLSVFFPACLPADALRQVCFGLDSLRVMQP